MPREARKISWSDDQRRLACRLLFVVMGLLPSFWVVHRVLTPLSPVELADAVHRQSGVEIRVQKMGTPRPGVFRLESLEVRPGSGAGLPVAAGEAHVSVGERICILVPGTTRISSRQLSQLLQSFCSAGVPDNPRELQSAKEIHLQLESLLLTVGEGDVEPRQELLLGRVDGYLTSSSGSSVASLRFRMPDGGQGHGVEISFERSPGQDGSIELIRLDSPTGPVPLWMAGELLDGADRLGKLASFQGRAEWQFRNGVLESADLLGSLAGIHLHTLSSGMPVPVEGRLDLDQLHSRIEQGKLVKLTARAFAQLETPTVQAAELLRSLGWWVADLPPAEAHRPTGPSSWNLAVDFDFSEGQFDFWPSPENGQVLGWNHQQQAVVATGRFLRTRLPLQQVANGLFGNPAVQPPAQQTNSPGLAPGISPQTIAFLNCFQLDSTALDATGATRPIHAESGGSTRISSQEQPGLRR